MCPLAIESAAVAEDVSAYVGNQRALAVMRRSTSRTGAQLWLEPVGRRVRT